MGKLKYLVIHCTDTPPDFPVTRAKLEQWHLVERGWDRLGYSDMIHRNGVVENLTPYNEDDIVSNDEKTWGCSGINSSSRHIVLEGGRDKDNKSVFGAIQDIFTAAQFIALNTYIHQFVHLHPDATIAGHYQFLSAKKQGKKCPGFDVQDILMTIGIPVNNRMHK